jgi:glycosyltransferase involved in cell wall biosynthesis
VSAPRGFLSRRLQRVSWRIPRLFWRLLRAEGAPAVASRIADRLRDARRRRSFRPASEPAAGFRCAVLNLAAAAPSPRLGGVQAQLLWRLAEEAKLRPIALLYPDSSAAGGGYRLELQDGRERRVLRYPPARAAATPRQPTAAVAARDGAQAPAGADRTPPLQFALADSRLEDAVAWAAACCGAEALHVEGLAGMPLASLLRLRRGAGLRLLLALHDFAAFCPRPHLMELPPPPAPARFCHYSHDAVRCAACLGADHPPLPPEYQGERRELARQLLAEADAVVYPSAFLARQHAQLFAGAGAANASVIAPGLPAAAGAAAAEAFGAPAEAATVRAVATETARPVRAAAAAASSRLAPGRPLRVAWVGNVLPHKGALVFEAALRALADAPHRPRFIAYGGGDPAILRRWRRVPGLRVRGYYRAGSLPDLLRRDGIDLALLLSVVPESYGLALDECAAAGVPAIAFSHGALAERLGAGAGLLLDDALAADPAAAGAALAALLRDLQAGRLPPPPPSLPGAGARAAAQAWLTLYRQLGLDFA